MIDTDTAALIAEGRYQVDIAKHADLASHHLPVELVESLVKALEEAEAYREAWEELYNSRKDLQVRMRRLFMRHGGRG